MTSCETVTFSSSAPASPVVAAPKSWQGNRSHADGVPVSGLPDRTLEEITRWPERPRRSSGRAGIGPAKLEPYADELLATLADLP